ncbi:hypothetical protein pfor_29c2858 [Rhodobacteraceae bacterium SB2]|nr:hypothetical protein pfor_29c2858 [Rhodobacteraceae bacterium SB2]
MFSLVGLGEPPPHLELVNYISYLFILEFFSPHVRPHKF